MSVRDQIDAYAPSEFIVDSLTPESFDVPAKPQTILEKILDIEPRDFTSVFKTKDSPRPSYTSVDNLRCTTSELRDLDGFVKKFISLFKGHGIEFHDTGRGLNGYNYCWAMTFYGDRVGSICADSDSSMGGFVELTGQACQLLQMRWSLWEKLIHGFIQFGFRITRLDVAADFKGAVWNEYNMNILHLCKYVDDGLFNLNRSGVAPKVNLNGDWLEIVNNQMSPSEYCPMVHCPDGLTINVGGSASANRFCVYEKGKQLLGKNPDMHDGSLNNWIRIERRFGRGSGRSKVNIPFEFALDPDNAFYYRCSKLERFIMDYNEFRIECGCEVNKVPSSELELERIGLLKRTCLDRTTLHVAKQSARYFRTLVLSGVDPVDFVNAVIHDEPNKGFSPKLAESFDPIKLLKRKYKNA